MNKARHYYVSGKVQGVWFRAHTKDQADDIGLTGWVKNLPDGRVEALVCGDEEKLLQMHDWLNHGPPLAKVKELKFEEVPWQEHKKFIVLED